MESATEYLVKAKKPILTNDRKAKIIEYRSIHKYKARKDKKWKKGLVKFMNEPTVTFDDITRWIKAHHWISDNDQSPKKRAKRNTKRGLGRPTKTQREKEQTQPQRESENTKEVNAVLEDMMNAGDPNLVSPYLVLQPPQEEYNYFQQQQQQQDFSPQQPQQEQDFSPQQPQPAELRPEDLEQSIRPEFLQSMMTIGSFIRTDPTQSHLIPRLEKMFYCYVHGLKNHIVPDHEKIIQLRSQMKLEQLNNLAGEYGYGEGNNDSEFDDNSVMSC